MGDKILKLNRLEPFTVLNPPPFPGARYLQVLDIRKGGQTIKVNKYFNCGGFPLEKVNGEWKAIGVPDPPEDVPVDEMACPICGRVYKDKHWLDKHIEKCNV